MLVWRIATENRKFLATDLRGKSAANSPGRWNDDGLPVVYAASTSSLAMLETTAHVAHNNLPQLKFLISILIPEIDWEKRDILTASDLPTGWNSIPHNARTVKIGSIWLREKRSLILCVPSAITPEETVVLINPMHPRANKLKAKKIRPVDYKTVLREINDDSSKHTSTT